jgi:hypothetical protein
MNDILQKVLDFIFCSYYRTYFTPYLQRAEHGLYHYPDLRVEDFFYYVAWSFNLPIIENFITIGFLHFVAIIFVLKCYESFAKDLFGFYPQFLNLLVEFGYRFILMQFMSSILLYYLLLIYIHWPTIFQAHLCIKFILLFSTCFFSSFIFFLILWQLKKLLYFLAEKLLDPRSELLEELREVFKNNKK